MTARRGRLGRSSSAMRSPTRGCMIEFNFIAQRFIGEHKLPQPVPVQEPSGPRTSGPNAPTTSASPGVPGATTSRATASASMTTAP